ncbi:Predicted ATPase [Chryseobacterium taichungense]|uniref:Predicted ATPase n=1 Tax=Chryseobacterium taichungense TaxID=295069 RepID=A0A1H7W7W4_9FLAO|nr:AAA family ATPase [Chryseobacterium taichungense]SEM17098.1 Predicted ATPase [Chryseobacterium taichungense]
MSKIKIKNFGPIKDGYQENNGWFDIKKVTVFIGNQGSGKSTVAKLISTFTWIEKALYKQLVNKGEVTRKSKFENYYCEYQNLKNYFNHNTEIEFEGKAYKFHYKNGRLNIDEVKGLKYLVPKIMYVPAERNFVSAVSQPEKLKYLPKTLYTFLEEFERSKNELVDSLHLPINNLSFSYDSKKRVSKIIGEGYDLPLYEASSGLQSSIPLFLVSKNLAEGIDRISDNSISKVSLEEMQTLRTRLLSLLRNEKLTEELRNQAIEVLSSVTKNDCFINVVEEPEQNLFPSSQRSILNSLLKFNSINVGNMLIMTTHSPYLINYLTLAVEADKLKLRVNDKELRSELNKIVPLDSTLNGDDLVVYQLDEKEGKIMKLKSYKGLPSDENYLNIGLAESNDEFSKLLDIEDLCQ